jgi:hypothetical protein
MSIELASKIEQLQMRLHSVCKEKQCPVLAEELSTTLGLIPALYEKIRHGEPGHEAWLKDAIEAHFLKKPMPDYVAK